MEKRVDRCGVLVETSTGKGVLHDSVLVSFDAKVWKYWGAAWRGADRRRVTTAVEPGTVHWQLKRAPAVVMFAGDDIDE